LLAEEGIHTPVRTLGVPDLLIEHGESMASVGLAPADIRDAVTALLDSVQEADSVEGGDGSSV